MNIIALIESGISPLLLFGLALSLGALHGLEPGHSKTMMAAYIVAIKGKVRDAVILGVSAAISHSIIVWILAFFALMYGNEMIGEQLEPWFLIFSGIIIIGISLSVFWNQLKFARHSKHHHHHDNHSHHHDDNNQVILDAHAQSHANEIKDRLSSGRVGIWQTILFGFSGGLIPCPAAITVFLICLNLGKISLGFVLVGAFSLGLALTLVLIGSIAALGTGFIAKKTGFFDLLFDQAPYLSSFIIALIGFLFIYLGYSHFIFHVH